MTEPSAEGVRFGALLRRHRLAAGLTQEELAARAELSPRAISALERGRTGRPYRRSALNLAASLGLRGPEADEFVATALARPERPTGTGPEAMPAPVPRQLPAAVRSFTGRGPELAALTERLDRAAVSVLVGPPGVGKTALAVQWAYRVAARFPDGQLYVDLHADGAEPLSSKEVLARLLRSLGVPDSGPPADTDELAAMYRSVVARRRMLVVLDNARDSAQVRPLVPGSPTCLTLVTSRDPLTGLVVRDGAERLTVDPLPLPEAVDLLRTLIGDRAESDRAAVTALANRCGRVPLALRVAAETVAARPGTPLADIARERPDAVRVHARGVDLRQALDSGQSDRYLRTALDATGILFPHWRLPAPELTGPPAPVTGPDRAREWLDRQRADLVSLIHLMRTGWPREAALLADALLPYLETGGYTTDAVAIYTDALYAARRGGDRSAEANALANLGMFRLHQGRYAQAAGELDDALALFRRTGNRYGQARALGELGVIHRRRGQVHQALGHQHRALALFRQVGDRGQEGMTLTRLAVVERQRGRLGRAAGHNLRALALFREIGDRYGEAHALTRLGAVELEQGRRRQAGTHHDQAATLFRALADRVGEAEALTGLAEVMLASGRYPQARAHYTTALDLTELTGNLSGQAQVHQGLARTLARAGDHREARRHRQQALGLYTYLGVPEAGRVR